MKLWSRFRRFLRREPERSHRQLAEWPLGDLVASRFRGIEGLDGVFLSPGYDGWRILVTAASGGEPDGFRAACSSAFEDVYDTVRETELIGRDVALRYGGVVHIVPVLAHRVL